MVILQLRTLSLVYHSPQTSPSTPCRCWDNRPARGANVLHPLTLQSQELQDLEGSPLPKQCQGAQGFLTVFWVSSQYSDPFTAHQGRWTQELSQVLNVRAHPPQRHPCLIYTPALGEPPGAAWTTAGPPLPARVSNPTGLNNWVWEFALLTRSQRCWAAGQGPDLENDVQPYSLLARHKAMRIPSWA